MSLNLCLNTIIISICCQQHQEHREGGSNDVGDGDDVGDSDEDGGDGDDDGGYCDTVTSRCSISACFANQNCTNTCFSHHTIVAATIYNHNYTNTSFQLSHMYTGTLWQLFVGGKERSIRNSLIGQLSLSQLGIA